MRVRGPLLDSRNIFWVLGLVVAFFVFVFFLGGGGGVFF